MADDQLNLLSRAVSADELDTASRDCAYATIRLVWNMVRFPPDNQVVVQSADAWKKAIRNVLTLRNSFVMAVLGRCLYAEGVALSADDSEMMGHFVRELGQRRIRKIVFWKGITDEEIGSFSELMSGKPAQLLEKGGPANVLKRRGVKHIGVIESQQRETDRGEETDRAYWEGKLEEIGLDKGEIVALLAGQGRMPRLLSTEVELLAQAMQDPQFLSEALLRVAAESSGRTRPRASDLRRVCERAEHILVVNSGFDPSESPRVLARATQAFDKRYRLGLVGEKLRLDQEGAAIPDERIFAFGFDEYAEYFARRREQKGWRDKAQGLWWDPASARAVAKAYAGRVQARAAVDADEGEREARTLEACLTAAPENLPGQRDGAASAEGHGEEPGEALAPRAAAFTHDLTEGYTYTLLRLYERTAADAEQARELFERLTIILEARLEMERMEEALALLRAMFHEGLAEETAERLRADLRESLPARHATALIEHLARSLANAEAGAGDAARVLTALYGQRVWQRVFELLLSEADGPPPREIVALLGERADELLPMLDTYLKDRDPANRLRATELLVPFEAESIAALAATGARDRNRHVRLLSLFALGHSPSRQVVQPLLEAAQARRRRERERCAAIWSLGEQGGGARGPLPGARARPKELDPAQAALRPQALRGPGAAAHRHAGGPRGPARQRGDARAHKARRGARGGEARLGPRLPGPQRGLHLVRRRLRGAVPAARPGPQEGARGAQAPLPEERVMAEKKRDEESAAGDGAEWDELSTEEVEGVAEARKTLDASRRAAQAVSVLRLLLTRVRSYGGQHKMALEAAAQARGEIEPLLRGAEEASIDLGDNGFEHRTVPLFEKHESVRELFDPLRGREVGRVIFYPGVADEELVSFASALASKAEERFDAFVERLNGLRVAQIAVERTVGEADALDAAGSGASEGAKRGQKGRRIADPRLMYPALIETMRQIRGQLEAGAEVESADLVTLTSDLVQLIEQAPRCMLPFAQLRRFDEDAVTRPVHTCLLSLTAAADAFDDQHDRCEAARSALLAEVGAVETDAVEPERLPDEPAERAAVRGALLLDGVNALSKMPMVTAFEHGLGHDFSGRPGQPFTWRRNFFTGLVEAAARYDRLTKPDERDEAFTPPEAVAALEREAGGGLAPKPAQAIAGMLGPFPPGCLVELEGGAVATVAETGPSLDVRKLTDEGKRRLEAPEAATAAPPGGAAEGGGAAERVARALDANRVPLNPIDAWAA